MVNTLSSTLAKYLLFACLSVAPLFGKGNLLAIAMTIFRWARFHGFLNSAITLSQYRPCPFDKQSLNVRSDQRMKAHNNISFMYPLFNRRKEEFDEDAVLILKGGYLSRL